MTIRLNDTILPTLAAGARIAINDRPAASGDYTVLINDPLLDDPQEEQKQPSRLPAQSDRNGGAL